MTVNELLTPTELQAIQHTVALANLIGKIVGDGPSRTGDMNELAHHIHIIQRYIMSQAAARSYPETFRLLGETIKPPVGT